MIRKTIGISLIILAALLFIGSPITCFRESNYKTESPQHFKEQHNSLFGKAEIIAESSFPKTFIVYPSTFEAIHQCLNVTASVDDPYLPAPKIKWKDETSKSVLSWPRKIHVESKAFPIVITLFFPSSYDGRVVNIKLNAELLVPKYAGYGPTKDWIGLSDRGETYRPSKEMFNEVKTVYFIKTDQERNLLRKYSEISSIRRAEVNWWWTVGLVMFFSSLAVFFIGVLVIPDSFLK